MSSSIRCRTSAGVEPRGRRGSLSEDESSEELGGRLAREGAIFGAGVLAAALPLGRPRGRFTTSGSGVSLFGGSTDGARANGAGGGGLSMSWTSAGASWSSVLSGTKITSI